jgi:hypothetical protein
MHIGVAPTEDITGEIQTTKKDLLHNKDLQAQISIFISWKNN